MQIAFSIFSKLFLFFYRLKRNFLFILDIMSRLPFYFPEFTPAQLERFSAWASLLKHWNTQLNLISRKDIDNLEAQHLLPCLGYLKLKCIEPSMTLLDLGTGGGLPGIPLAIALPEVHFILVDSVAKKTRALEAICKDLKLDNVSVICSRAEDLKAQADFVIGRAVAPFEKLIPWSRPLLRKKSAQGRLAPGLLYMKGTHYAQELAGLDIQAWQAWPLESLLSGVTGAIDKYIIYVSLT